MKSKQSGNEELHKRVSCEKPKYDAFGNERKKKSNLIKEIIHDFVKEDYKFLVYLRHDVERYYECNMSDLKSFRCIKEKISQMFREIRCQEKSTVHDDDYQFKLQLQTLEDIESSILPSIQPLGLCTPDSDPIHLSYNTPASQGESVSNTMELSLLEQSNVDSVHIDSKDSSRTIQEQKGVPDVNDGDFLRNALGVESDHVIELPTDQELEQFINLDSSEEMNLNFYNVCKSMPDSSVAEESPTSVDNSLLNGFENDCYVAVCSMTNETVSNVHEGDHIHHTESSDMNKLIQFSYEYFKQI